MMLLRLAFLAPLLAALVFGLTYLWTRDARWLRRGAYAVGWTLVAVLGFFLVLFVEQFLGA